MVIDIRMKNKSVHKLTPQDKKIVEVFEDLGMPKNLAKTLMYISQVQECRSADIERGANLRQPEVSVSMQELTRLGWVSKRNQKKEGKGRPIYIYRLESPINNIITHFEEEKLQEIESIKQDLSELRNLLKVHEP